VLKSIMTVFFAACIVIHITPYLPYLTYKICSSKLGVGDSILRIPGSTNCGIDVCVCFKY